MYYYHQKHPVNYFLLGIFTISLAFAVGLTCAFTEGIEIRFYFYLLLWPKLDALLGFLYAGSQKW
jgi:hypothetical protein